MRLFVKRKNAANKIDTTIVTSICHEQNGQAQNAILSKDQTKHAKHLQDELHTVVLPQAVGLLHDV
jgi:hypothetical protein